MRGKASKAPAHVLQTRAQQGRQLRALYRSLGWSRADCGKFFHVTERTLRNWEAGRTAIPAALLRLLRIHCGAPAAGRQARQAALLRLLRIHCGMELPGAAWAGWSLSRGKLCTPEGHELEPKDAAWWALLVRRAEVGSRALKELARPKARRAEVVDSVRAGHAVDENNRN